MKGHAVDASDRQHVRASCAEPPVPSTAGRGRSHGCVILHGRGHYDGSSARLEPLGRPGVLS
jgi:hypothetical protein